jgi:histidyl-tRNA synthetase
MSFGIPFEINPRLVRGLDYYCHTAFELITEGAGGQQSSLGGGGRYDGLLTQLGGPAIGATGAGIGVDRVIEEMERQGIQVPATSQEVTAIIAADEAGKKAASELLVKLMVAGKPVHAAFDKEGVGAQIKAAARVAKKAVIIGQQEVETGMYQVKDLESGEQKSIPREEFLK